jgi:Do/DeqQ family serine protease
LNLVFKLLFIFLIINILPVDISVADMSRKVPNSNIQLQLSYAPLVKKTTPAVVNIYARKVVRERGHPLLFDDPFFQRFFGENFALGRSRKRISKSLGSGVIVRADGLVVTNKHVVQGADEINIVLSDRREFSASLVITDHRTDLAVLKVNTNNQPFPFLELSNSDTLEVGDLVLAIGNPFGVGQTVTGGIVSALARTMVTPSDLNYFIQTDAAINPGNSGGALVSMSGKLAGINTAIFSKTGGSLGIGFAIPSNMVRAVINGITKDGKLIRGWLGAEGQSVSQEIANSLGMPLPTGVLISKVYKNAAAYSGGIRVGDVILTIGQHEVNYPKGLSYRLATLPVGETVPLHVWRRKSKLVLKMVVAPPPDTPKKNVRTLKGLHPLSGAIVANMSPAFAIEVAVDPFVNGVMIVDIARGSPANRLRFEIGDFIREVNNSKVDSVSELSTLLGKQINRWSISIEREGKVMKLNIKG